MLNFLHQFISQRTAALHGGEDLLTGQLIPWSGEDCGFIIVLTQHGHSGIKLGLIHLLGTGEENSTGVLNLIVEELAEILHINFALYRVYHSNKAVQIQFHAGILYPFHGGNDVRELAYAGGLDNNAVGSVGIQYFLQSSAEITYQRAADTAGVHLGDFHAGAFQKTTVDTDFSEFVFNQDDLFTLEGFVQKFFDQSGLSGTQKAGNDVDFGHERNPFQK